MEMRHDELQGMKVWKDSREKEGTFCEKGPEARLEKGEKGHLNRWRGEMGEKGQSLPRRGDQGDLVICMKRNT